MAVPHINDCRLVVDGTDYYGTDGSSTDVVLTPYIGNDISLYDGAAWQLRNVGAGVSLDFPTGEETGDNVYDIFAYFDSPDVVLEAVAWASKTARAVDIVRLNGVWVKDGEPEKRYVGTVWTREVLDNGYEVVSSEHDFRGVYNPHHKEFLPILAQAGLDHIAGPRRLRSHYNTMRWEGYTFFIHLDDPQFVWPDEEVNDEEEVKPIPVEPTLRVWLPSFPKRIKSFMTLLELMGSAGQFKLRLHHGLKGDPIFALGIESVQYARGLTPELLQTLLRELVDTLDVMDHLTILDGDIYYDEYFEGHS